MDTLKQLSHKHADIVAQIAALGPMRMGTVIERMLATKRTDGSTYQRGPYLSYTFKHGGKTCGKHLRSDQEAERYRRQIETFRRYQELSAQLVELSQRMADLEVSEQPEGGKKNSRI